MIHAGYTRAPLERWVDSEMCIRGYIMRGTTCLQTLDYLGACSRCFSSWSSSPPSSFLVISSPGPRLDPTS